MASHQHYDADGVLWEFACSEATFRYVGQDVMERLKKTSVIMPVPWNGPADGQPEYAIPCPLYASKIEEITVNCHTSPPYMAQMIDPSLLTIMPVPLLMPTPSPTPIPSQLRLARKAKDQASLETAKGGSYLCTNQA